MEGSFERQARAVFDAFSSRIAHAPAEYPRLLTALDWAIGPSREIVIAGREEDPATQAMIREIYSRFIPNKVLVFHPVEAASAGKIEALSPFIKNQNAVAGRPAVYICENYVCRLPMTEISKLKEWLESESRLIG